MPDSLDTTIWPRASITALRQIVPAEDTAGRQMVRLGVWPMADADRPLAALAERPAPTEPVS
jgi:hypothetical protein